MMYSGDDFYGDEITSGLDYVPTTEDYYCDGCGYHVYDCECEEDDDNGTD